MTDTSDPSDLATAEEERERERAVRVRRPVGPEPTGQCHYCEEPLPEDLRFCDEHCRDDWQWLQQRKDMRK